MDNVTTTEQQTETTGAPHSAGEFLARQSEQWRQTEIDKMMNDPKSAYHDPKHKDHAAAVAHVAELFSKAYPPEQEPAPDAPELKHDAAEMKRREVDADDFRADAVAMPALPDGWAWDWPVVEAFANEIVKGGGLLQHQTQALIDAYAAVVAAMEEGAAFPMGMAMRILDREAKRVGLTEDQLNRIKSWASARLAWGWNR